MIKFNVCLKICIGFLVCCLSFKDLIIFISLVVLLLFELFMWMLKLLSIIIFLFDNKSVLIYFENLFKNVLIVILCFFE